MDPLVYCIAFIVCFLLRIPVCELATSPGLIAKDIDGEQKKFSSFKFFSESSPHPKTYQKQVKVPQYMLDLFASVTDDKAQETQTDKRLPGNIVRSFYSEALSTNNGFPIHLVFNITVIPITEVVRKSELHIYRRKSKHLSKAEKKQPHFYMIMIRSPGFNKSVDNKLLSSRGFGWVQFDVTSVVRPKVRSRDPLLKLSLELVQTKQEELKPEFAFRENEIKEPVLVVYTDEKQHNEPRTTKRRQSNGSLQEHIAKVNTTGTKRRFKRSESCHRKDMVVNLRQLRFDELGFVQPLQFNAYRCSGSCSAFTSANKTGHAIIQALISELKEKVDAPCCSPWELGPQRFLVIEKHIPKLVVALKPIYNIVVKSCGCK